MRDFFDYLRQRLWVIVLLLPGLTLRRLRVLRASFLAMILKRPTSGPVPPILMVKLTSRCNLSCIMCPKTSRTLDYYRDPVDIDCDRLTALLRRHAMDLVLVQLHGGEPLMHRRILDILDVLDDVGLRYTVTTNGHYLTPAVARRLTRNCIRLIVSVDAASPALYQHIRRGGDFERVKRNVALVNQAKREAGSWLPYVRVVMAVFSYNLHEMTDMVELCHAWRVPAVVFQEGLLYDNPDVRPEHLIANSPDRVYRAVEDVKELSVRLGTSVRFDFDFWKLRSGTGTAQAGATLKRCFYLYFTMLLQERFRTTYCFGTFDHTFPMEGIDLRGHWNGAHDVFYRARRDLKNNQIPRFCERAYHDGRNCVLA